MNAAVKCGFKLIVRNNRKDTPVGIDVVIRFVCQYGLLYQKGKKKKEVTSIRRTSTRRPISEEHRCKFGFTLKMHSEDPTQSREPGRWFIMQGRADCGNHCGHAQYFPKQLPTSTRNLNDEDRVALKVKFWTDKSRPIVRGEKIPDIPEFFEHELSGQDDGENDGGFSLCMEIPNELEAMRTADFHFTQESQQEAAKEIEKRPETKDQELIEMVRGALKYIGSDEEEYSKFFANLNALVHKVRSTFVKKTEMRQKNDPYVSKGKEVRLEMVTTGRSKKKNEKRKKGSHECTHKRKKLR